MWWTIAIIFGILWIASWIWYIWSFDLTDDYIRLAEAERWKPRPCLPIVLWPEMLRAWKDKQWLNLFLCLLVNLTCILANLALIILALGLAIMLLTFFI